MWQVYTRPNSASDFLLSIYNVDSICFVGVLRFFANNLKTDIFRGAKTAFHFLRIVITHRNRDHNMFKAMKARGATFCVFTAAVEKTYTKRPRELILWSFGPIDVMHTQNIKIKVPWA
jgi:hypothetical protein